MCWKVPMVAAVKAAMQERSWAFVRDLQRGTVRGGVGLGRPATRHGRQAQVPSPRAVALGVASDNVPAWHVVLLCVSF